MSLFSKIAEIFPTKKPAEHNVAKNAYESLPLPDGVSVTGLYMYACGSCIGTHYIMLEKPDGTYFKMTDQAPDTLCPENESTEDTRFFYGADKIFDSEHASSVKLRDDEVKAQIAEIVGKYGVLSWDGFNVSHAPDPSELDGDSYISLYMTLSDGKTVRAVGNRAKPRGWNDFYGEMTAIFEKRGDYSHYYATDFSASECTRMDIAFRCDDGRRSILSFSGGSLQITLTDDTGTDTDLRIDNADTPLPYRRFTDILSRHGAEKYNNDTSSVSYRGEYFDIKLSFADNKSYMFYGETLPPRLYDMRAELMKETAAYCEELKSGDK